MSVCAGHLENIIRQLIFTEGVRYAGESISNQPNLFPVEIHLFFFNVIVLLCDALRPTVFKCHQSRTEKVRFLSIDPLLNCRQTGNPRVYFFKFGNK